MQSIEITVKSAENLRVGKRPVKKNAFVTVQADSPDRCCTTKMSVEGGCNPAWNEKLALDLQPAALRSGFLTVEVYCKMTTGNKLVWGARVPVADFLGGFQPRNHLQLLSYRLRDSITERNGIINISVKVKSQEPCPCSQAHQPTAVGVPVREHKRLGGLVTGVPVAWFPHQRTY